MSKLVQTDPFSLLRGIPANLCLSQSPSFLPIFPSMPGYLAFPSPYLYSTLHLLGLFRENKRKQSRSGRMIIILLPLEALRLSSSYYYFWALPKVHSLNRIESAYSSLHNPTNRVSEHASRNRVDVLGYN